MFSSRPQARAREGHQSELQELLERWQQEKAETEREHEKQLLDVEQKVAAVQAQQQEEQTRRENAEREVKAVKGELVCFCEAGAVGDGWGHWQRLCPAQGPVCIVPRDSRTPSCVCRY